MAYSTSHLQGVAGAVAGDRDARLRPGGNARVAVPREPAYRTAAVPLRIAAGRRRRRPALLDAFLPTVGFSSSGTWFLFCRAVNAFPWPAVGYQCSCG